MNRMAHTLEFDIAKTESRLKDRILNSTYADSLISIAFPVLMDLDKLTIPVWKTASTPATSRKIENLYKFRPKKAEHLLI